MNHPKPKILVSACMEFKAARYDGTMISDQIIKDMKDVVDFIPVCPEMAIGMPAPRDAVRLIQRKGESLKLVSSIKGVDYTKDMLSFSKKYIDKTFDKDFDGFILKAKSPTCGTDNVKIYADTGKSMSIGAVKNGMFAEEIVSRYPKHPIESERRMSNFSIREHFYIRVFTAARFKEIKYSPIKNLVSFHSTHKYLFMTFNQTILRKLGGIVANHDHHPLESVYNSYEEELFELFKNPASKQKRINVLTHIYGYFKNKLTDHEKAYYFETQNDYLQNHLPFSNPLRILQGFAIRFNEKYLIDQIIFEAYPKKLLVQLDSGKKI